jgi:hypothetical protein
MRLSRTPKTVVVPLRAIYACSLSFNGNLVVSDGFNPYREWLGLGGSSPNYYELLGLPLQESDPAKIAAAADRAITRVRSFRPGPQAREWAGLLDELRNAKECLLDADCRARYDAEQALDATAEPILPPESPSEAEGVSGDSATIGSSDLPEAIVVESAVPAAAQIWSAGPSPMYGFAKQANAGSESSAAAITHPTPSQSITSAMVIPQQPVLPASYGTPQRATFRAAETPLPQVARPRGRGVVWGLILLLWLVVGGLTYRLSIVTRQQKAAQDAAASEAETKQSPTKRPAKAAAGAPSEAVDAAPFN